MKQRELSFYVGLLVSFLTMFLVVKGSAAVTYDLMKYYPLKDGVTWNYLQMYSGGGANYEVFCSGGVEMINGVVTKKFWQFDSGSLDAEGVQYEAIAWNSGYLKSYKEWQSGDGHYFLCNPPLRLAPRYMSVGQTHTHSTTCTEYDSNGNAVGSANETQTIKLEAIETVKITTGAFTGCLKLSKTRCDPDCDPTTTTWLAPGVGIIKSSDTKEVSELISYTDGFQTFHPEGLATFKRAPLEGFDENGSMDSLIDYSFHKPTLVNIGTGQHTIGIQVSPSQYVGRLYIYVDKNINADANLRKTSNWQVYWGESNTGPWTQISLQRISVSVYDPLNNIYRYEIRFSPPLKHAFYKAVNKVPVSASGITDVFVTEIEAYGVNVYP